jgi:hypothetical protein
MLISELEAKLKATREEHGDLPVETMYLIKYQEKIIDRLIISNIQKHETIPYALFIYFGAYKITFNGDPADSLKDACDYFKLQISKISPFKEDRLKEE